MASKLTTTPGEILREGQLEKRSDSLLQLWKKKRGVLTDDRLRLFSRSSERAKELRFHSILKVDCVEHTRKHVYFTIVTIDYKEIDFRCTEESCWNAFITLALIEYQNRRALEGFRRHRLLPIASEEQEESEEPRSPSPCYGRGDQSSREPAHAAASNRIPGAQEMPRATRLLLFAEDFSRAC
ncbi:pleckstrin homology-like domain family A member 2 [Peromyscus californicus insignis]|uniref:pleckstrin homology-like domain family A member 2 n=1 Tax=Peromyscus californicus insignis TaxID=564181 RepID=UPI0022A7886F|nr:pleckstrin homology-like domain family A member 2 [Peromyscus californicus insignis]